ncbi:MAG: class I SAM-dependent methyltransferase, partial [Bacteroidota bacterium]
MEEKEWFEDWFDSPYYHLLYQNRSEEEAADFIKRISTILSIPSGAKVLDAACGKGRHSRTLAELGFDVTGIDLSKNSIAYAKQFETEHLKFAVNDIRDVYKENEFDYVFNLFSSFGYSEEEKEDYKAMNAFAGNLKPGGTLVLDYINSEVAVKGMKPKEIIPRGSIQFHIQKRLENGFIKKKIGFLAEGEDHTFEEQLKVINLFKFENMLKEGRFELKKEYGDYELNDFIPSVSPRLILVA